jgi:mRNA capping enzyme, beta chain
MFNTYTWMYMGRRNPSRIQKAPPMEYRVMVNTMDALFARFKPIVTKYLKAPQHEIEFRIGTKTAKSFDTNVGMDVYMNAIRRLSKYEGWESVKVTNDTVYYGKGGKRAVCNSDTDEITRCIKTRVCVEDCKLESFDVRLGISKEVPYEAPEDEEEFEKTKTRTRHSFIRKNLSIDVTMIRGDPDDMDQEEDVQYQIELEIQDPSKVGSEAELFNIMHKIKDVIFIL